MPSKNKCKHPACNCMISEEAKYCSTYCEDAADTTEIACNCGHAGCGTDEVIPQSMTGQAG